VVDEVLTLAGEGSRDSCGNLHATFIPGASTFIIGGHVLDALSQLLFHATNGFWTNVAIGGFGFN